MGFRFSIRLQLMVLSLFLFTIPYLGYNYVWELEQYLRNGQEQTMIGTARAVATALHERPALFDSQSAYLQDVRPGTDLYAPPIPSPIRLDGELNDWQQVSELISEYDGDEVIEYYNGYDGKPTSLSFTHMVGRYGQFLYAMFEVSDDTLLWRQPNSLSVETGDHLLIGMETPQGELARYVVAPYESGGTARAVATALHERPALFDSQSAYLQDVRPGTDLYAPPIPSPIRLDGELNDWQQVSELISEYDGDEVIEYYNGYDGKPTSLSFTHMVGRYGQFLYAMFEVSDDTLLWRQPNSLSVETGDHLLIGMETPQGELARYVVAPYESGWVNAYKLAKNTTTTRAVENALSIQGRWQETATGYNIELRFPLSMTTGGLAFTLVDVDNSTNRL